MLSDFIFRLIVLFLPSQLGLHFWPEYSRSLGLRVDYLSPTLYLTQLLIFSLLITNIKKIFVEIKKNPSTIKFLLLIALLNIYFSINTPLTSLKWLEIVLYYLLFVYLKSRKDLLRKNLKYLYMSMSIVFIVQLLQLLNQKSLGGLFYWLGEREFNNSSTNLPKYFLFEREYIRVPAIFSHANSLAGFMFLALISLKLFKSNFSSKIIAMTSILLSGSKNVFLFLALYLTKKISLKIVLISCLTVTILLAGLSISYTSKLYTVSSRLSGANQSLKIIKNHSLFGTGLGSFINGLDDNLSGSQITYENLQPVHNIYLLLLSELGFVGIILLAIAIYYSKISPRQSIVLSVVLLTGLFDHYWLTLIQNKVLLTVLLASFPVEYET